MLPCYVGDSDAVLTRIVREPIAEGAMGLWVLSHPDVRRAARVRALTAFIADTVLADRYLFEGRKPQTEILTCCLHVALSGKSDAQTSSLQVEC
jgi:hypothetical protein